MSEENKVYLGNLSYDVTEEDLNSFLSEKGVSAASVLIIRDKYSNRSKGFGFAECGSKEEVEKVIAGLNDVELKGRKIIASPARPRQPKREGFQKRGR